MSAVPTTLKILHGDRKGGTGQRLHLDTECVGAPSIYKATVISHHSLRHRVRGREEKQRALVVLSLSPPACLQRSPVIEPTRGVGGGTTLLQLCPTIHKVPFLHTTL